MLRVPCAGHKRDPSLRPVLLSSPRRVRPPSWGAVLIPPSRSLGSLDTVVAVGRDRVGNALVVGHDLVGYELCEPRRGAAPRDEPPPTSADPLESTGLEVLVDEVTWSVRPAPHLHRRVEAALVKCHHRPPPLRRLWSTRPYATACGPRGCRCALSQRQTAERDAGGSIAAAMSASETRAARRMDRAAPVATRPRVLAIRARSSASTEDDTEPSGTWCLRVKGFRKGDFPIRSGVDAPCPEG